MSTLVKATAIYPRRSPNLKRSTTILSDGSAVMCVVDNNISGGAGDNSNVTKIYIYHSTTRLTWTLKNTITPSADIYAAAPPLVSLCADASDNLYITYVRGTDDAINYVKLTWASGPTWTVGTTETVTGAPGLVGYYRQIDMDVHASSAVPIVVATFQTGTTYGYHHFIRRTSDSTWRLANTTNIFTTGTYYHADISVAWNKVSGGGPSGRTYYAMVVSKNSVTWDGGEDVLVYSFDTAAGTASTLQSTISNSLNVGEGARLRRSWLFSSDNNEWSLVTSGGLGSAFCGAMRFTITPGGSVTTITGPYTETAFSMAFKDWSPDAAREWNTAVYADDRMSVVGAGTNGRVYEVNGRFTRNVDNANSVIDWDTDTRLWDNNFISSSTRYPIAFWGGNNNRVATGLHLMDVMYGDGPQDTTVASANPYNIRHNWNYAPVAPTNVKPSSGSLSVTNIPPLSSSLDLDVDYPQARIKVIWQVATNSGFTLNLRTVTQSDTAFQYVQGTYSGNAITTVSSVIPNTSALFSGTWYVRAAYVSELGQQGAWSAAQSFTVSHPPSAIGVTPSGSQYSLYVGAGSTSSVDFDWTFSDPSPGDAQTAYRVIIEDADTGASILNTGKVTSTVTAATLNIPSSAKDVKLRWKVDVWDIDDVQSTVPSAYQLFYVGSPPTVNVTAPVEASTISTPVPSIAYTPTMLGARTMKAHRIVVVDESSSVVMFDSNWVTVSASGPFTYQLPSGILLNSEQYRVWVYVRDSANLEGSDSNLFNTSWTAPAAPTFSVITTFYDSLGYVKLSWTNATIDLDFTGYRIYRRLYDAVGPVYGPWVLLGENTTAVSSYEFHDWLATSGTSYQYAVVQAADRFGAIVESAYNPTAATVTTDKYWLIHPLDELKTISLHVSKDDFNEEYEQENFHVLGRGRHVDYGDRLGYDGTMSLQLRDSTVTARAQRLSLQALKAEQIPVYMRNPFGDIWLITLGDISFSRVAGMARHEALNVDFSYTEVAP